MRKKISVNDCTMMIDPGWHTGWSYWRVPELLSQRYVDKHKDVKSCLNDQGVINLSHAKGIDNTVSRINYMSQQFEELLETCCYPNFVWFEGTAIWEGSLKSMTAAKRGDIMTLSYLIGAYIHVCYDAGIDCDIITAPEWKGQMTDDMVACKVQEVTGYGLASYPQHTLDAIGMGLSGFGILENKVRYSRKKKW